MVESRSTHREQGAQAGEQSLKEGGELLSPPLISTILWKMLGLLLS